MDTPSDPRALGDYGERLACRYLAGRGFTILDRNWRCARGELDIVARDGDALVVCEVKTRSDEGFGAPFEAVTRRKLAPAAAGSPGCGSTHTRIATAPAGCASTSCRSCGRPRAGPQHQHLQGVC